MIQVHGVREERGKRLISFVQCWLSYQLPFPPPPPPHLPFHNGSQKYVISETTWAFLKMTENK